MNETIAAQAKGATPIDSAIMWTPDGLNSPGAGEGPEFAPGVADKTVSTVLGEIAWLLTQSPAHKALTMADFETLVMPAVLLRQFKMFYDAEKPIPVGCILFAKISDAMAARLDAGGRLQMLDDWRSGETVRIVLTVAPFGGEVRL